MGSRPADPWHSDYTALIAELPAVASKVGVTFCGMSACIDTRFDLHEVARCPDIALSRAAASFVAELAERAARGVGGEIRVDWPEGPEWLERRVGVRHALGGTGPHAASVLSTLGAPALLALGHRRAHMMDNVPGGVLLAEDGRVVQAAKAAGRGGRSNEVAIFEYTAGLAVGRAVPSRSSRIIVRFCDGELEQDPDFDALTVDLAGAAGSGLISGFSILAADRLDDGMARVFAMTRAWRDAGLETIHLELAGYAERRLLDRVLAALPGAVTSIGMSHSELLDLDADGDHPFEAAVRLGERLGLDRVCVHADHWAMTATRNDPDEERRALMAGSLVAAARAAVGKPVVPDRIPSGAIFHDLPFASARRGSWSLVVCSTPYLQQPATTLGLGDTFTAGCLLMLGRPARQARDAGLALTSQRPAAADKRADGASAA